MKIIVVRTPEHYQIAVKLFSEYADWLGVDLCFQSFDKELQTLAKMYAPPSGELFLIENENIFIGCAGLRQLDSENCELKRMYVKSEFRGLKLGEQLMEISLKTAKDLGYKTMKLDTLSRLTPALKLYEKYGFQEIKPYNFNPENDVLYFEKSLTDA